MTGFFFENGLTKLPKNLINRVKVRLFPDNYLSTVRVFIELG